ncbi:hypothetical protein Pelo_18872 [Pelomyxa schiedti]|nr:hypothetical protein Pelo_18872 [Pelomyxa schiedti]
MNAPNPRIFISTFTVKTTKPFTITVDVSKAWMKALSLSDVDICRAAANGTWYSKRQYQPMTLCGHLFTFGSWAQEYSYDDDVLRFVCSGCKYNCSSPIDPFYTLLHYYVIRFATDISAQSNPFILRKGNTHSKKPGLLEECQAPSTFPQTAAVWPFVTPRMIQPRRTARALKHPISDNIVGRPSPVSPLPLNEGETDNNSSLYQKPPCSQLPSAPNPRISISTFTVETTKPFTMTVDVSKAWMKAMSLSDEDICRAAANGTCYSKRQYQPMTPCGQLFTIGSWSKESFPDGDNVRFVCSGCKYNCSSPIDPFYTPLQYYVICFATDVSAQSNSFVIRKGNTPSKKPKPLEECQVSKELPEKHQHEEQASEEEQQAAEPQQSSCSMTPRMIKKRRTGTSGVEESPVSGIVGPPSPSVTPLPLDMI